MSESDPKASQKSKKSEAAEGSHKRVVAAPAPRPALRRAADADVHPVTGRRTPAPSGPSISRNSTASKGFKPAKGGPTTADALMGSAGDKLVDLGVRVPKSVRKKLRQQAKERGVSVDELVANILAAALPR